MASDQSSNLQLTFLASGQAQKHVTVNESLLRLDALVQLSAASASTTSEPGSPVDGTLYILPAGKSGASWGAMANGALAYYRDGVWEEIAPREGWLAFTADVAAFVVFDGAAWVDLVQNAPGAFAFTGDLTPAQITANQNDYNPTGLANAAVLRLSTDASRKLTGLAGGADGRVLYIANVGAYDLVLSNADAASSAANRFAFADSATLPANAAGKLIYDATASRWRLAAIATPRCVYDEFTASGTWAKRAGAVSVDAEVIGGGGGGGGGARVASGNACSGGGGGGGAYRINARYKSAALGASETITVGAGGSAGAGATSAGNAGGNGGGGSVSQFGGWLKAFGGGGGAGGQLAANSGGGGGAGPTAAGGNATGASGGSSGSGVGGTGGSGTNASYSSTGGAAGGGGANGAAGGSGVAYGPYAAGAGAAGGGVSTTPAAFAGGASASSIGNYTTANGGAAGVAGAAGSTGANAIGQGGAGGGSNTSGAGGAGGAGGSYGGAGGGGGSAIGGNGGDGGAGAGGIVRVWTYF